MTEPGLCGGCRHGRAIRSDRGSIFWLCRLSATDPRFTRYPALPVLACAGFERADDVPRAAGPASDAPSRNEPTGS
jgi:hypothetical protein